MYAYFNGIIEEKNEGGIVIEVNGVGYNIMMPTSIISELPEIGNTCKIYTYTSVKEDAISLFGFTRKDALNLFKLLISVSGIGPKGGLSILSALTIEQIKTAIITGDSKLLSSPSGIGKKSADRLIIDLKDKIEKESIAFAEDFVAGNIVASQQNMTKEAEDAVSALVALGYGMKEAKNAVISAIADGTDSSDTNMLLKNSLKYM